MKKLVTLLLAFSSITSIAAQSHSRRLILDMILSHSRHSFKPIVSQKNSFFILKEAPAPACMMKVEAVPRYCLAKGAIVCRFEEYVQLHSPFKLNIGVGGE